MAFDAFISYSRAADGELAPALQRGLQRLAKPWSRRQALRVFRDVTGLAVSPGLWPSITDALDQSEYFILLASPGAAQSEWVNREIEHWMASRPNAGSRVLPVLTEGTWVWDKEAGEIDWDATTAAPPALAGVFRDEPRHLDLMWARSRDDLDLHNPKFRDAVADLAAPLHGIPKDELEGEDVRQHRRAVLIRRTAVAALAVLVVGLWIAGVLAQRSAAQARAALSDLEDANGNIDDLTAEGVALQAANAAAEQSLEETEAQRVEAEALAAEAQEQADEALAALNEAEQAQEDAEKAQAAALTARDTAQVARDQAVEELAVASADLVDTRSDLGRANASLNKANADLDEATTDLNKANADLDEATTDLNKANADLGRATIDLNKANADLDEANTELSQTKTDLSEAKADLARTLGNVAIAGQFITESETLRSGRDLIAANLLLSRPGLPPLGFDGKSAIANDYTVAAWVSNRTATLRLWEYAPDGQGELFAVRSNSIPWTFRPGLLQMSPTNNFVAWDNGAIFDEGIDQVAIANISDLAGAFLVARPSGRTPNVNHRISSLAFTPDDSALVSGGTDGSVALWDLRTGVASDPITTPLGPITFLAFDLASTQLATGDGDDVVLWDLVNGSLCPRSTGIARPATCPRRQ